MLLVLNHELGRTSIRARSSTRAFYDRVAAPGRDAPGLGSRDQTVTIPGLEPVRSPTGESIRTEISTKYDRESVASLFEAADLSIDAWPRTPTPRSGLRARSARVTSLSRAALLADLENHAFAVPASASLTPRRIGAETEFIPVEAATWRRCPIEGDGVLATLPFLRRHGAPPGWTETRTAEGTPVLPSPRRRDADLRAGRPARVQHAACR